MVSMVMGACCRCPLKGASSGGPIQTTGQCRALSVVEPSSLGNNSGLALISARAEPSCPELDHLPRTCPLVEFRSTAISTTTRERAG
jgi:hypothetical protein